MRPRQCFRVNSPVITMHIPMHHFRQEYSHTKFAMNLHYVVRMVGDPNPFFFANQASRRIHRLVTLYPNKQNRAKKVWRNRISNYASIITDWDVVLRTLQLTLIFCKRVWIKRDPPVMQKNSGLKRLPIRGRTTCTVCPKTTKKKRFRRNHSNLGIFSPLISQDRRIVTQNASWISLSAFISV